MTGLAGLLYCWFTGLADSLGSWLGLLQRDWLAGRLSVCAA
jgi:hypothetical protein